MLVFSIRSLVSVPEIQVPNGVLDLQTQFLHPKQVLERLLDCSTCRPPALRAALGLSWLWAPVWHGVSDQECSKMQNPARNSCLLFFGFFSFFFFFLYCTDFARPSRPFMRCGYRGTFCTPGQCPHGNAYLGVCRFGHACCKW